MLAHGRVSRSRRHDNIAELLGVKAGTFESNNAEAVMGIRRQLLEYVKRLKEALAGNSGCGENTSTVASVVPDGDGWPQLVGFDSSDKLTKDEMEGIIRAYLSAHYGEHDPSLPRRQ